MQCRLWSCDDDGDDDRHDDAVMVNGSENDDGHGHGDDDGGVVKLLAPDSILMMACFAVVECWPFRNLSNLIYALFQAQICESNLNLNLLAKFCAWAQRADQ